MIKKFRDVVLMHIKKDYNKNLLKIPNIKIPVHSINECIQPLIKERKVK